MATDALTIGFVGTGVMGRSMAAHLLSAGHQLKVFTRTREKAQTLLEAGAIWSASAGEAAEDADVVITMVGYPQDVEEIYLGERGIVARAKPGAVLIDMTTSSPKLAQRIASAAAQRGVAALDAPVSGGDVGAREAKLVIMVGGEEEAFARVRPVLALMGQNIARLGGPGAGQFCKMANQIAVAVGMLAWAEALAFAASAGLDPQQVWASISGGAAGSWAMTNLAPRALDGNYAPGFYVKHILKDIRIALDSAAEVGAAVPGLDAARVAYERVAAKGWSENGTQVIYRLYAEARATGRQVSDFAG